MIRNILPPSSSNIASEYKELTMQLSVITNILFSMAAIAFAIYYASFSVSKDIGIVSAAESPTIKLQRILLGIGGALFLGAAETFLFLSRTQAFLPPPPSQQNQKSFRSTTAAQDLEFDLHNGSNSGKLKEE